ncbi:MAG: stage II sporulation protein M [Planctomycetota bacterium]|nr:stage II sporulation protein M [Planctomycetota bacterium]
MKVADLLLQRQQQWQELELLCDTVGKRRASSISAEQLSTFASLYRSACADLALADSYNLPPETVEYLHRLVGRAHSRLYRSRRFQFNAWFHVLVFDVPRRILRDGCVQFMFIFFYGTFLLSAYLAYETEIFPDYHVDIITQEQLWSLEEMYATSVAEEGRGIGAGGMAAGFYANHNTGIGLSCFVTGILIIPGLLVTLFNSAFLGAIFGYMVREDVPMTDNFVEFVTAHGPFELTAIVLAAAAGLRLGISWVKTNGLSRSASLRKSGMESMPVMGVSIVFFFLAALIEGFISPSGLHYNFKLTICLTSTVFILVYLIGFGLFKGERHEIR